MNWDEVKQAITPIPDYEDLARRWREAYAYNFACRCYNFTIPQIAGYTQRLLGEDTRGRYAGYLAFLLPIFHDLEAAGVQDLLDLTAQVDTREQFEGFIARTGLNAKDVAGTLNYLVRWFIPMKKPVKSIYREDPRLDAAVDKLRSLGIRSNLDLLEAGQTRQGRRKLADSAGVAEETVTELVNRADFSRMPWASAATISNIFGAGYPSIAKLAGTDLEKVMEDFFRWGESIGKNLKFGNEIDSSHRIAQIVPRVVEE